jgi:hypothetical protein
MRRNNSIEQRQRVEGYLIYRIESDEERREKTHIPSSRRKKKKEHMTGQSTLSISQYNRITDRK